MITIKKMKQWTLVGVSLGVLLAPSFLSSLSVLSPSIVHAEESKDKDKDKKDKEKKKDNGEKRTDNDASGKSVTRSTMMDFNGDARVYDIKDQWMFGPSFFAF